MDKKKRFDSQFQKLSQFSVCTLYSSGCTSVSAVAGKASMGVAVPVTQSSAEQFEGQFHCDSVAKIDHCKLASRRKLVTLQGFLDWFLGNY